MLVGGSAGGPAHFEGGRKGKKGGATGKRKGNGTFQPRRKRERGQSLENPSGSIRCNRGNGATNSTVAGKAMEKSKVEGRARVKGKPNGTPGGSFMVSAEPDRQRAASASVGRGCARTWRPGF